VKSRFINIALVSVILFTAAIILLRPSSVITTYAEFQSSIWKISNQCIADYYYDNLTEDGIVMSFSSIQEDCEGEHLEDVIVKIYDGDTEQETTVKAYKLHGLIINLGGNANFMDKVILRRVDNDEFVMDITEDVQEMKDENPEDKDVVFVPGDNDI